MTGGADFLRELSREIVHLHGEDWGGNGTGGWVDERNICKICFFLFYGPGRVGYNGLRGWAGGLTIFTRLLATQSDGLRSDEMMSEEAVSHLYS